MDLALEKKCKSISFCGISTGIYGYPPAEAAPIAMNTVKKWFENHPDADIDVRFCCFTEKEYEIYSSL